MRRSIIPAKEKKPATLRKNMRRVTTLFLAFAIVLNILYLPLYTYLYKMVCDGERSRYEQAFESSIARFNTTLSALSDCRQGFQASPLYRSATYENFKPNAFELISLTDVLRSYISSHLLVWDCGLVYEGNLLLDRQRVYYGMPSLAQYEKEFLTVDGQTVAPAIREYDPFTAFQGFRHIESSYGGSYDALTLVWRWSPLHEIYLYAMLPAAQLESLFILPEDVGSIRLSFEYRGSDHPLPGSPEADETKCESFSSATFFSQLQVKMLVPQRLITESMVPFRRLMFIFLTLLICACVLGIIFLTRRAVRPFNTVATSLMGARNAPFGGEHMTADEMAMAVRHMDSQLDDYRERVAGQMLEKALYRGFASTQERQQFIAQYPCFPARWQLCWVQLDMPQDAPEEHSSALVHALFSRIRQCMPDLIVLSAGQSAVQAVCPADSAAAENIRTLCEALSQESLPVLAPLFSAVYSDLRDLPQAQEEIEFAASTLAEAGREVPRSEGSEPPVTIQKLQNMFLALMNGDLSVSLDLINACADSIASQSDMSMIKTSYRLIANMLVLVKAQSSVNLNAVPIPPFRPDMTRSLFEEELPETFRSICALTVRSREQAEDEFARQTVEWIDAHLQDPALSVAGTCDAMKVSASTLQKYLKAAVQKSFSAYVEEKRMSRARTEILTTQKTIDQIAAECGYGKTNTFYKAYKRYYGENPSAVREGKGTDSGNPQEENSL